MLQTITIKVSTTIKEVVTAMQQALVNLFVVDFDEMMKPQED